MLLENINFVVASHQGQPLKLIYDVQCVVEPFFKIVVLF